MPLPKELKKILEVELAKDRLRNREHQENCMLRLTKRQMEFLREQRIKYKIGRGTYMRRLLIIDMLKREWRKNAGVSTLS
jgi:hypothetical protein